MISVIFTVSLPFPFRLLLYSNDIKTNNFKSLLFQQRPKFETFITRNIVNVRLRFLAFSRLVKRIIFLFLYLFLLEVKKYKIPKSMALTKEGI